MFKIRRSNYAERYRSLAHSRIPLELERKDSHLVSAGTFFAHMLSPDVPEPLTRTSSAMALRQVLLMRMVGAKYMPADTVGYSYSVRVAESNPDNVAALQNWNASSVVWVAYDDMGPDLTHATLRMALDLTSKSKDELSERVFYLICDMRGITEVGIANYLYYCDKIRWLSETDRALLVSTFSVFREAVRVYGDGETPDWARAVVHSTDGYRLVREEGVATRRLSPVFDGYVADRFTGLSKTVASDVAKSEAAGFFRSDQNLLKEVLEAAIPGWVSVLGLRHATPEALKKAVERAVGDARKIMETLGKARVIRDASEVLAAVGGFEVLSSAVIGYLDEYARLSQGDAPSEEQVLRWIRRWIKDRLGSGVDERKLDSLKTFLMSLSSSTPLPINHRWFWEHCVKLEQDGKVMDALLRALPRLTDDLEVIRMLRDASMLLPKMKGTWSLVARLLDRKESDLLPFIILRVGEELGIGVQMDKVYAYAVPGELGESLGRLFRSMGLVVPVSVAIRGGRELVDLATSPSSWLSEAIVYSAFYSFGVPVQKMRVRFGKYERFVPMIKHLNLEGFDRPLVVSLPRVSDSGAVVWDRRVVGVAPALFALLDEAVLGYVGKLREWGHLSPTKKGVYHGLLYLISGRNFAGSERLDDAASPFVANYEDLARAVGELRDRLEGEVGRIEKLNSRAREMSPFCYLSDDEFSAIVRTGKVSSEDQRLREKWKEWVAKKYSDYVNHVDRYDRRVAAVRANLMSWVQYVHPEYMEKVSEAMESFYRCVLQFDGGAAEARVKEAVEWLSSKELSKDVRLASYYRELVRWQEELRQRVEKALAATSIRVGAFGPDSVYSVFDTAPTLVKMLAATEDAERFKKVMAIVVAVEDERRKGKEGGKGKEAPATTAPVASEPPKEQQRATEAPGEGGKTKTKLETRPDTIPST